MQYQGPIKSNKRYSTKNPTKFEHNENETKRLV